MRLTSRLSLSLIAAVAVVSVAFAYFQIRAQSRGMERDLERQSLMLAESLGRSAEPLAASHSYDELQRLVDRFKDRETVAGVGIYDPDGAPLAFTTGLAVILERKPAAVGKAILNGWASSDFFQTPAGRMYIVAVPLFKAARAKGALAIVSDASY